MPIDPNQLTLDLDGWEGPLDLLLSLARAQKVDLRAISILALVEQYLRFVERARTLRLELAAEYLVMAAWLAYLKSALLLPRATDAQPDADALAGLLQRRLERLAAMRDAGARLVARDRLGRDVFARGAPEGVRTVRAHQWQASLYDLIAAYGRTAARTRPVMHVVRDRQVMTLDVAIARVASLLGIAIDGAAIERFLPEGAAGVFRRSALASSFLAALELARQGHVGLRQEAAFGPLYLTVPDAGIGA